MFGRFLTLVSSFHESKHLLNLSLGALRHSAKCHKAGVVHRDILSTDTLSPISSLLRFKSSLTNAGLKVYKPTTPGFRGRVITSREGLWKGKPMKSLTVGLRKSGGRNNTGRTTSWHKGGGSKRKYRLIDFKRLSAGLPGVVERLEYDPNRTARIALVKYTAAAERQPSYKYIVAPNGIEAGDMIDSGEQAAIKPGNTLPMSCIPIGMQIHNIELHPGRGGQLVRAAGAAAVLVGKGSEDNDRYVTIKLPSGEQRLVLARCKATIGSVSNPQHKNVKLGKAGANRWKGRRPVVRGVAMNPVDHPHGGGRGKSKGRISQSPWGKPTKGYRTRNNPLTDKYITISRHEAKRKLLAR